MPDKNSATELATARTLWWAGTVIAAGTAVVLLLIRFGEGSTCLVLATTGVSCPGCGMTRAVAAILRGDWQRMWTMHPLAPFLAVQGVIVWAAWGWTTFVRRQRFDETWLLWLLVADFVLLVLVWFGRLVMGTLPG